MHAILHYARHIRNEYTIECTLYIAECTVYTTECTMYIAECTVFTIECILYIRVVISQIV